MSIKPTASSQTMCYVIAYDIPDDRRRSKVHKILSGFGKWTQYSVFECFLSRKELVLLKSKLAKHLVDAQDSVRFYPLCANCLEKVETVEARCPTKTYFSLSSVKFLREVVAPELLSIASRKRKKALTAYY